MERSAELIEKLKKDFEQRMPIVHLLNTVGQLQLELINKLQAITPTTASTAVIMPSPKVIAEEALPIAEPNEIHDGLEAPLELDKVGEAATATFNEPLARLSSTLAPPTHVYAKRTTDEADENKKKDLNTPTKTELAKDVLTKDGKLELNDLLQTQQTELADKLKDAPINDLRKGISLNERFVFVKELFRGDDVAFERSIKTINACGNYADARLWIERELRTLNGWRSDDEIVEQFYDIVKRRFV